MVASGLQWLANHQRRNGAWDRVKFDRLCPELDRCRDTAVRLVELDGTPAVTGLALLAFLGNGQTHVHGEYSPRVALAVDYLLAAQRPDGGFGGNDVLETYNTAIATLALAEALGMTRDVALRPAVEKGIARLIHTQQKGGGWDYTGDLSTGRSDMSITGWATGALTAAHRSGIAIPDRTILGIVDFLEAATNSKGEVYYADSEAGVEVNAVPGDDVERYGASTTAIGAVVRHLLGWQQDAPTMLKHREVLMRELPSIDKLRGADRSGLHNEYYWYYGTLAIFYAGGDAWKTWNRAMITAASKHRDISKTPAGINKHAYGSWPAFGPNWGSAGRTGSRVYSTSLCTMTLEVYYRAQPARRRDPGLIHPSTIQLGLATGDTRNRTALVRVAGELHPEIGEPVLVDLLKDRDPRIRVHAAIALIQQGSPRGRETLQSARGSLRGGELAIVDNALARIDAMSWPARLGKVVRVDKAHGVIVFETGDADVYLGQALTVQRGEKEVAAIEVTRRDTAHALAAAKVTSLKAGVDAVLVGDEVVTTPTKPPSEQQP